MIKNIIKAPYFSTKKIIEETDKFRKEFWDNSVPVDIEKIIEFKLGISIIPVPELCRMVDVDALIASNWKYLYVDRERYMEEKYSNRLRFSLAHEIGHFVLHKEIYDSLGINDVEDFYKFAMNIDEEQYGYFEIQANKFASHLLIPHKKLIEEKDKLIKKLEANGFKKEDYDGETLNSVMALKLADNFGTSSMSVEYALNRK
ncbi:MAG: ImmA/IrrE family metallo-endopeptidase [Patescibacteria group bacterium]|jgi:Zn-dependent peptidase ImmA (M78 family)